jgi:hypothetical protein
MIKAALNKFAVSHTIKTILTGYKNAYITSTSSVAEALAK